MNTVLRWTLASVAVLATTAVAPLAQPVTAQSPRATPQASRVPLPRVSIPPEGRGKPFRFSLKDIASFGYVEEEFLIEGTARSYVPATDLAKVADGRWDTTPTGPAAPYKVRIVVRRPKDAAAFNGTVLVDWLNVSAGYDSDTFDTFEDPFMRKGYVYVGVTAQAIGANHMRGWDPARYGSLSHPGDSYSYDIFSQAAEAIRYGKPMPLGPLTAKIKHLVAWGGSQSGARLITYVNAVNPTARAFDGIVPFISARGTPISQEPLAVVAAPTGAAVRIRTDVPTPILMQLSESEIINAARGLHQQPDSATFRMWEYTGLSHANSYGTKFTFERDRAHGVPIHMFPTCEAPVSNDMNSFPVYRATLDAMHKWLASGQAPAHAPRMQITVPADEAQPATIPRDPKDGMARGGIRLPPVVVPVATYWGTRPSGKTEHMACPAFGSMDPWNGDSDPGDRDAATDISPRPEPGTLARYGSQQAYVQAVQRSADDLARKGFIPDYDRAWYVEAARKTVLR